METAYFLPYYSYTRQSAVVINSEKTLKHLTIILFLIFISCKNAPKTETQTEMETEKESETVIDKSVSEMWNNYIKSNPEFKDEEIPESEFFHDNEDDANRLAELTANGKKRASSGLYSLYKQ